MNSEIGVKDITDEGNRLLAAGQPTPPNLGGKHNLEAAIAESNVAGLMAALRKTGGPVYELTWTGSKVPEGAVVAGHVIAWTQNGQVTSDQNIDIGTYERIVDGGPNNEHKMIVYIYPHVVKLEQN